ncbi:hypothetical protein KFK14_11470 [Sphingobium phenoxybenzoativorans]|uniref:Uncharacterized protein n=1 Tax=Sphingobium phenoxybenzoativorans TaxID=1592790 RepID=A0A975Q3Y4_9SPHN|nr:hypothetical protein [Sphingobium phenoxybenzoativorans]QUT07948.1 hypothetical protein KFK14_11470 [Sphingobium phenoxybenzoativorans]
MEIAEDAVAEGDSANAKVLTAKIAAEALNGRQYRKECPKEFAKELKAAGLVAVFGASDDLMEIRGAVTDEVDCYMGGTAYFTDSGLYQRQCDSDQCPHEKNRLGYATKVEALWCEEEGYSWAYRTVIPHETFEILEDDAKYCRGIVFALADVPF